MKKALWGLFCCLFLFSALAEPVHAFKLHSPFSKKSRQEAEKMVQTKEEWQQKAQNVNLEDRKIPAYQKPEDKDFKPKESPNNKFVKYNVAPGEQEVNLSNIKKKQDIRSQGVIDPHFKYMAYGEYYYSPMTDQISSDIFIQELKGGLTRMKKALSTNVLNVNRTPAISTGTKEFYNHMFSTLTIVDFSQDSTRLLVKEKIGSSVNGIYRNYVWVYFIGEDAVSGFAIKFSNLNEEIKKFYAKKTGLALDNYRWDIKPLGFSKENPEIIIAESFVFDKDKKPMFLGAWGINCQNASIELLSEEPKAFEISVNALIVKEYLP